MKNRTIKKKAKQFIKLIKQYDSVVIFHHIRPDGDCLGSQQGLKKWLSLKFPNKKIYAIGSSEGLFKYLNFEFDAIPSDEVLSKSLGIVVDANYSNRIKHNELILDKKLDKIIRIDHHPENDDLDYAWRFVDSSYCSSAEQITHLIKTIDKKKIINKKVAMFLYLGIYTDSGRFFYDYTSARSHNLASYLFNSNFDFFWLHKKLSNKTIKEIEFNKHVLLNYKTYKNIIYYFISQKEIKELNLEDTTINRVDFLANIEGYDIWIFFIENEDGTIRVRLRSSEKDISILAKEYNGGGHKKASGAMIDSKDRIDELIKKASLLE